VTLSCWIAIWGPAYIVHWRAVAVKYLTPIRSKPLSAIGSQEGPELSGTVSLILSIYRAYTGASQTISPTRAMEFIHDESNPHAGGNGVLRCIGRLPQQFVRA
jgi:hypothetical protein